MTINAKHRLIAAIGFGVGLTIFLFSAVLSATASITSYNLPSPKPGVLVKGDALYEAHKLPTKISSDKALKASDVLSKRDVDRYKLIFDAQNQGDWALANRHINNIKNKMLMGHVLYQRYMHPTAYHSSYDELEGWLKEFGDHPNAMRVYKLANARYNGEENLPIRPSYNTGLRGVYEATGGKSVKVYSPKKYTSAQKRHYKSLKKQVYKELSRGRPSSAIKILDKQENRKILNSYDYDRLLTDVAKSYFHHGKSEEALNHSHKAYLRSGKFLPLSGWVAGLASWSLGQKTRSAIYFEAVADNEYALPSLASAGGYWAHRAHKNKHDMSAADKYLKKAAQHPYSFYGIIAHNEKYNINYPYSWVKKPLAGSHVQALENDATGRRVIALLKVGLVDLAEMELKQLSMHNDPMLKAATVALSNQWEMPSLSLQLANAVKDEDGSLMDPAMFPMMPWQPQGGYIIDQAVVHAFVKQESRFDPKAKSGSGAIGLMQLMPRTASYISGEKSNAFQSRSGRAKLMQPEYNLALGQKYIDYLLKDGRINGDMFKMAVSYNAGPGRMSQWIKEIGYDDPLFFIERIPSLETRMFVEHIMSNLWIYRTRHNQPAPSLQSLITNNQPIYIALDKGSRMEFAAN